MSEGFIAQFVNSEIKTKGGSAEPLDVLIKRIVNTSQTPLNNQITNLSTQITNLQNAVTVKTHTCPTATISQNGGADAINISSLPARAEIVGVSASGSLEQMTSITINNKVVWAYGSGYATRGNMPCVAPSYTAAAKSQDNASGVFTITLTIYYL